MALKLSFTLRQRLRELDAKLDKEFGPAGTVNLSEQQELYEGALDIVLRARAASSLRSGAPEIALGSTGKSPKHAMTPERYRRLVSLYEDATEQSPGDRAAFLEHACEGDPDLLSEVESMLAAEEDVSSSFMESFQMPADRWVLGRKILHYTLVEKLGAGGMGVVYKAHDPRLNRFVALKLLLPQAKANFQSKERFLQEARSASALNHPNIVTIYDISEENDLYVIVMECVSGKTLSELIGRVGLSSSDVLNYGVQITNAMAAAHAAGIVHRDLKPTNIMVTPTGLVKILDFGLATLTERAVPQAAGDTDVSTVTINPTIGFEQPRTSEGFVVGTPGYMSPEQAQGKKVDARSDIFSLGAVLYKMVTGTQPFHGDSPASIVSAVLRDKPEKITALAPSAPVALEKVIERALCKNPEQRVQSMSDLKAALTALRESLALDEAYPIFARAGMLQQPTWQRGLRRKTARKFLAFLVALVLTLGIAYRVYDNREVAKNAIPLDAGKAPRATPSVAVLDFQNRSGDDDAEWLSEHLAKMLADNLSIGNQLLVIPAREVLLALRELHISDVNSLKPESLAQLKRRLNADYIVTGSYRALGKRTGGQLHVDIRLMDTTSGLTLASVNETGTENDVLKLLGRPSERLRDELGVSPVTASELSGVYASFPNDPAAARPYIEGLKKLNLFDSLGAIPLLQKAIGVAPKYAMIHADLADAWSQLGYDSKARKEAQAAFDLSSNLSPQQRSLVEGRYCEITGQWDKALEIYRNLWIRFPNQPEFGLRLAATQTAAGRGMDALATIELVRKLQSHANPDPRLDIQKAEAYETIADFRGQRESAARAADFAKKVGAKLLLARARTLECRASLDLGLPKEAMSACQEARQIDESLGNRAGTARAINGIANTLARQGDFAAARKMYEEALKITREIDDKNDIQEAMNNLANMLFKQGDNIGAKRFYEQGLQIAQERGDKVAIAHLLGNIGSLYDVQGNLSAAEKEYDRALFMAREVGNTAIIGRILYNSANLHAKRGDLDGAMDRYQEAKTLREKLGSKSGIARTRLGIGDVLLARDDLDGAARSYEQALSVQNELGEKNLATYTRLSLAEVVLERGQSVQAEALFRQLAEDFQSQRDGDDETLARAGLVRALLLENKLAEAKNEVQRASDHAKDSADITVRLTVSLASGRLSTTLGKYAEARTSLEASLAEASKAGLVGFQFEVRLALGELELSSTVGSEAWNSRDLKSRPH